MVHQSSAGPAPIPHKTLTLANLTEALLFTKTPEAKEGARRLMEKIRSEDGVERGVESFYRHLPLGRGTGMGGMRCDVVEGVLQGGRGKRGGSIMRPRVAVWWSTEHVSSFGLLW
jgi:sterol 3beta-glucosyltransferase